jgi:DinB superfamily
MADLRYPIGKFEADSLVTPEKRRASIEAIAACPAALRAAIAGLSDSELEIPYRPGGWTVRQVVHHVPDSHMNSYVRFKLALTEDEPTIRPYMENLWAELPEAKSAPIEFSLSLLDCLHKRWVLVLRGIKQEEWKRHLRHPELGLMSLEKNLALYAWHGKHHVAHITELRQRMGWG